LKAPLSLLRGVFLIVQRPDPRRPGFPVGHPADNIPENLLEEDAMKAPSAFTDQETYDPCGHL
jgi:hypothetical protein